MKLPLTKLVQQVKSRENDISNRRMTPWTTRGARHILDMSLTWTRNTTIEPYYMGPHPFSPGAGMMTLPPDFGDHYFDTFIHPSLLQLGNSSNLPHTFVRHASVSHNSTNKLSKSFSLTPITFLDPVLCLLLLWSHWALFVLTRGECFWVSPLSPCSSLNYSYLSCVCPAPSLALPAPLALLPLLMALQTWSFIFKWVLYSKFQPGEPRHISFPLFRYQPD